MVTRLAGLELAGLFLFDPRKDLVGDRLGDAEFIETRML
jgi:hypothetical protein